MTADGIAHWAATLATFNGQAPVRAGSDTNWLGDKFPSASMIGTVGVIEYSGPLLQRPGYIETQLGAVSYDKICELVDFVLDAGAKSMVISADSPGGSACGMLECADKIAEAAAKVPVVAFTNSCMTSAAYGLACPATAIYSTKTANLASVGVRCEIADWSEFVRNMGVKMHSFVSGKYKNAGSPYQAMTDDHADYFSGLVTKIADDFKGLVRANRPGVSDDWMQGQCCYGQECVTAGFSDGIVSGLGEVIDKLSAGNFGTQQRAKSGRPVSALDAEWAAMTPAQKAEFGNSVSAFAAFKRNASRSAVRSGGGGSKAFTRADFRKPSTQGN
jgi:ClpP class serine protease